MHFLHLLLSAPVGLYSASRRIFVCHGELTSKTFPLVADLPVYTFGISRLFVYINNLVPRGMHSRWNRQATDLPEKEAN